MDISFTNPALLPWLALGLLPVLIHLFARAKPPRLRFSNVEFIRRVVQVTERAKRPRDLLLLLARLLAVLLLVAAFTRPRVIRGGIKMGEGPRNVVAIIDNSASMGYVEGGQTRLAVAAAKAARLLDGLAPNDRANVVWLKRNPEAAFPDLGVNKSFLTRQLRHASPTFESGNVTTAFELAADLLEGQDRAEIAVFSDFQASQWKDTRPALPGGVSVTAVHLGAGVPANESVHLLRVSPPTPVVGVPATLSVEVGNWGPSARTLEVSVSAGEARQTTRVALAAGGIRTVAFDCVFTRPGQNRIRVEIGEDGFAADNRLAGIVEVEPELTACVIAPDPDVRRSWERLLRAYPWIDCVPNPQRNGPVPMPPPGALVLDRWPGTGAEAVRSYVEQGGTLVWLPAGCDREAARTLLADADFAQQGEESIETVAGDRHVRIADPDSPLLSLFRSGEYGDLSAPVFRRCARLAPEWRALARPLLEFGDGTPALALIPAGSGRIVLWNMPIDGGSGTFCDHGEELIQLFGEVVATGAGETRACRTQAPGTRLALDDRRGDLARIALHAADGKELELSIRATVGGAMAVSEPVAAPGFYQWQTGSSVVKTVAVALDPVESDLRSLPSRDLGATVADTVFGAGQDLARLHEGRALWPALLSALVGALALESVILLTRKAVTA